MKIKLKPNIQKDTNKTRAIKKFMTWIKLVIATLRKGINYIPWCSLKSIYTNQVVNLIQNNGLRYTIKYFKEVRCCIYKFLASDTCFESSYMSLTKDKIPIFFQDLIPIIRNKDKVLIQALLSMTTIGRLFKDVGKLSTISIEKQTNLSPNDIKNIIPDDVIKSFVKAYKLKQDINECIPKLYIRTKVGPNGPAFTSILDEAKNLPPKLIKTFREVYPHAPELIDIIEDIRNCPDITLPPEIENCINKDIKNIRAITVVEDKELKDRVVAIFDYWSQVFLKPIHSVLLHSLKGISSDCTFNQGRMITDFQKVNKIDYNNKFYSYDLESATDNLPLELQRRLFAEIFGNEELSYHWKSILNDYPFLVKDPVNKREIFYGTGQPMGAYSSWAMLALTHHLIVYYAMIKTKSLSCQYMLLGDDITIYGNSFANTYKEILQQLELKINFRKTIESYDSFEFVKRFFNNNTETSPLPLGQLNNSTNQYWDIVNFLEHSGSIGYENINTKDSIWQIIVTLNKKSKRTAKSSYHKVIKYLHTPNPYQDNWDQNLRYYNPIWLRDKNPFGCSTDNQFIQKYILELYVHCQMNYIHESIVRQVKFYNKFAQQDFFKDYRLKYNHYHPFINILQKIATQLQEFEYGNSSNPVKETERYFKMKVKLKDFAVIPDNFYEINNIRSRTKENLARVAVSNKLEQLILQLADESQRQLGLANDEE